MKQIGEYIGGKQVPVKSSDIIGLFPMSVQSALVERHRDFIGKDGQFDTEFNGYAIIREVPAQDIETAWRQMRAINNPADNTVIMQELVKLKMLTKMRAETENDAHVLLVAFAEEMATYPADIIQDACRKWARMEKFFPAWAELKDMMDFRLNRRKRLEQALADAML